MGYGHGLDLRTRIVNAYLNGEGSIREVAERFSVSPTSVQDYLKLHRQTNSVAPRPVGGGVAPMISDEDLQKVQQLVDQHPDATTEELADDLAREHAISVSRATMGRALQRLGLTRKKNAACDRTRHSSRSE